MRGPLHIAAVPYGLLIRTRNRLYDWGWTRQYTLPCRVVSVGNLTVGGTGKTPVVIWIAEYLLARGFRVGVLSRGYRRHSGVPQLMVSDGRALLADPMEAGDEPYLIAARCRRAVVAVGADRYRLGRWVLEQFPLDYVLLDDGFQHRSLRRDVDLLLVDASDATGLHALLPAGRLREPLSSVSRASAIILTRAETDHDVAAIRALLGAAAGADVILIRTRFDADGYVEAGSGALRGLKEAVGKRALIFSGIGNAASFRRLLIRHGVKVEEEIVFPDHHAYSRADMDHVRKRATRCRADLLVTTEKDAVKITSFLGTKEPVWAVRLGTEIVEGRERLEKLILEV